MNATAAISNEMTTPRIHLIYAVAANGTIGYNGTMPWHLSEDLVHFKQLTLGQPVIMGRKTWDSLPERFRPLPGRTNIVITRQADWVALGALTAHSLEAALALCSNPHSACQDVWILGGAEIYRLAEPLASFAEVTEIHAEFVGDAFAPKLGPRWCETARSSRQVSSKGLAYSFVSYSAAPGFKSIEITP